MSPEVDELLKKAMALPPDERGALAASLIDSLEEASEPDLDVEAAWQLEVVRRMEEIESGKVKPIPWLEVKRRAREMFQPK
ncbi:MAG: addiction module protein [Candidatus Sulfotelmatobacter sp.]